MSSFPKKHNVIQQGDYDVSLNHQISTLEDQDSVKQKKKDLETGQYHIIDFEKRKFNPATNAYDIAEDSNLYRVTIISTKNVLNVKKKHYWIHSHHPNYGKSYSLQLFCEQHNA